MLRNSYTQAVIRLSSRLWQTAFAPASIPVSRRWTDRTIVRTLLALALGLPLLATRAPFGPARTPAGANEFVTRTGSRLLLHGHPFRFSGANIYWLGLDWTEDNLYYPSHFRVDDALTTAREMGATVVRADTLGMSQGCRLCVEPSLGHFNDDALTHIDYAIKRARDRGLRLIIELVDNWHYPLGGKHTFTDWRGLADEDQFFTDPTVIGDFERYIDHLLTHVNTYTGVAYKDDPTILAWETGDELRPPRAWTATIARYLKRLAPHHLVLDGSRHVSTDDLSLPSVDLYSDHYYPMSVAGLRRDAATVRAAGKVFVVGEYSWNDDAMGEGSLARFLAAVQAEPGVGGDLYWSLFGHSDTYGYVRHDDGYTLHYPGDTPTVAMQAQLLRHHAYAMSGRPAPPAARPTAPLITGVARPGYYNVLTWRGAVGAATYSVEASTVGPGGPWQTICRRCATDTMTPWGDPTARRNPTWYRVTPYNPAGALGPASPAFRAP